MARTTHGINTSGKCIFNIYHIQEYKNIKEKGKLFANI